MKIEIKNICINFRYTSTIPPDGYYASSFGCTINAYRPEQAFYNMYVTTSEKQLASIQVRANAIVIFDSIKNNSLAVYDKSLKVKFFLTPILDYFRSIFSISVITV